MKTLFADTGYWMALLNTSDTLHQKAINLTTTLMPFNLVTSEMIFTELLNSFSKKGAFFRQGTVRLIRRYRSDPMIEIVPQTRELFSAALDLYEQRPDKAWSHTDCASFYIVQQRNIQEALAYDRHFEQAGFVALLR